MRLATRALLALACSHVAAAAPADAQHLKLHVVYVTNRDRPPLPDYQARCSRIMRDIQAFYRDEMARWGHGPRTFPLDLEDGQVKVHLVTLDADFDPAWKWSPEALRPPIAKGLAAAGIDVDHSYFVAFENAYWQDGDTWRYDVVYTGSGNPDHGACWIADHALLDAAHFRPGDDIRLDDRGQKLSLGYFNAKMIGGIAHELGHGLGLPHNCERPLENRLYGKALMGGGNYTYRLERVRPGPGAFLTAAHAFALSLHPLFNGRKLPRYERPTVTLADTTFDMSGGQLLVATRIQPAEQVAGLVIYHDELPAGINQDYDAWSYLAQRAADGRWTAAIDLPKAGQHALKLRVYFTNGLFTPFDFTHEVSAARAADLVALRRELLWQQTVGASDLRDVATLEKLLPALREQLPDRVPQAERLLTAAREWAGCVAPADVPRETSAVALSRTRWSAAEVGWYAPSSNGVLSRDGGWFEPLASATRQSVDGLYAHAEARYDYALGGRWSRLETKYGLQTGHDGSVVFVILVDGQERFRSPLTRLRDGEQTAVVDVTEAQVVSLVTLPGDDGKANDWGIWIEPWLRR